MPGYSPKALNYQARNANSVTVMIGDQVVAFAQSTSHSINFGSEELYGIGSSKPQEIQQMRISSRVSIDGFALTEAGINLLAGGTNIALILANNQFDLHIVDGQSQEVLYTYVGAVADAVAENIAANQPVTQSIPFKALDVLDPQGNSILDSNSVLNIQSAAGAVAGGLGLSPAGS